MADDGDQIDDLAPSTMRHATLMTDDWYQIVDLALALRMRIALALMTGYQIVYLVLALITGNQRCTRVHTGGAHWRRTLEAHTGGR